MLQDAGGVLSRARQRPTFAQLFFDQSVCHVDQSGAFPDVEPA